jgi:hypothetical protein
MPVCVACCFTGLTVASFTAACTAIFAVAAVSEVVAVAAAEAVTAAAVFESILICADDTAGEAMAAALAAIAAVAIASGAVALPDAGVAGAAALASVVGTVTARTTATGFGVVTDGAPGVAEAVEESAAEAVLEDGLPVDFAVPFALSDFALDPWVVSALEVALALLSALFLAAALRSSELLLAAWSEAAASRDRVLSAEADASSARGCEAGGCWGAGCCCAVEVAPALLAASAAAVLLSISVPKLLSCDGSGRAGFGGAV